MMNLTSLKTMQLGVRNCLYNSRVSCRTTAGICRLNRLTQLITTYNRVTLLVYLFLVESLPYRRSVTHWCYLIRYVGDSLQYLRYKKVYETIKRLFPSIKDVVAKGV